MSKGVGRICSGGFLGIFTPGYHPVRAGQLARDFMIHEIIWAFVVCFCVYVVWAIFGAVLHEEQSR
jgi:uncharacterized membrane protein